MASSTSSLRPKRFKYDVFLSFRGEDVRKTFIDHLYASLDRQGILTFRDNERLNKGDRIDKELIQSIQDSKIFIIVFSKNYASSSWCLNELVEIMKCQKNNDQIAYPVFYNVDPSEVRKQHGSYGEALTKHNNEDVGKWREALREAGSLSGYDLKNTADGHEAEVIKLIVAEISSQLRSTYYLSNDDKLVGMETRIPHIMSCLDINSNDVRMIGIKGMGGAGKTTLARVIFERISFMFEGVSFVDNVREKSNSSGFGLLSLQEKILRDVLKEKDITISHPVEGKLMMKNRLGGIKTLVVLDDVDDSCQLDALVGESNWFKPGSRIIITTRDLQVLKAHGVEIKHDVSLLSDKESICLFNRHAFKGDIPIERYEELSLEFVRYAAGLPLTIKVLGSLLKGEGKSVWIDILKRLETIPLKRTMDILELSYKSLEDEHKEIFLDVACLLKRWPRKDAIKVLESCGLHAIYGLRVLEQKCLITFSPYTHSYHDDVYLDMHDHIQEMGQNIVRRDHPDEPGKHSRLWRYNEIDNILVNELGTDAIRYIKLSLTRVRPGIIMKGLENMKNLRFLALGVSYSSFGEFDKTRQYLPNALQYLSWICYPFCSLPKRFQANNLVALEMTNSSIKQLWEEGEKKVLNNLKFLDLSGSQLTKLDLRLTPNLEVLKLSRCRYLLELLISIGCPKLRSIVLSHSKLTKLDLRLTPNLEVLKLVCQDLLELHMPTASPKLRLLSVSNSRLTKLDLGPTLNLEVLKLSWCHDLSELHMPIGSLKLRSLDLQSLKLRKLELTPNLEVLDLKKCDDLEELHMSIECLKLRSLKVRRSKLMRLDFRLTPNVEVLLLEHCLDLEEFHMPSEFPKLRSIHLKFLKLVTLDLGLTPNLEKLILEDCHDLQEFHLPIVCTKLRSLELSSLKLTKLDLRLTPNLNRLRVEGCEYLLEVHMPLEFQKLRFLFLIGLKLTKLDLRMTPNLEVLSIKDCHDLLEVNIRSECLNMRTLELSGSKLRKLDLGLTPNLEELNLLFCEDLEELQMSIGCPKLKSLNLSGSKLMKLDLGLTPNLQKLELSNSNHLLELHMPVACLQLRFLKLYALKLKKLNLGLTPNLNELKLKDCHDLEELHIRFGCLKELSDIELVGCSGLKSLVLTKEQESHVESSDIHPVNSNHDMPKISLSCLYKEQPSSSTENLKLFILGTCSCSNLRNILETSDWLPNVRNLNICCSIQEVPKNIGELECVKELKFSCTESRSLPSNIYSCKDLKSLKLKRCTSLVTLPLEIDKLTCLEKVHLWSTRINQLPNRICRLKHLKSLQLVYCWFLKKLPEDLGKLECLEKLNLFSTSIRHLPNSICSLKHLKSLVLGRCQFLEKLPEDLGQLECLETLIMQECNLLREIPNSICKITGLKRFGLTYCAAVEYLPEEIGHLESLMVLNIVGNCIRYLPESISSLNDLRIIRYTWHLDINGFTFASVLRISNMPKGGNSRYVFSNRSLHAWHDGSNQHTR